MDRDRTQAEGDSHSPEVRNSPEVGDIQEEELDEQAGTIQMLEQVPQGLAKGGHHCPHS